MLSHHQKLLAVVLASVVLWGAVGAVSWAQTGVDAATIGQGFSFQGLLKRSGAPYTGACNLTFGLWNAAASGTQLGTNQTVSGVSVVNGIFTVQLNGSGQFGASAFDGNPRWLEISAQCTGDLAPTLIGRQPLNATPYAVYALNSDTVDGVHASSLVNIAGGTMTGNLTLPKIIYTTPREHVTSLSSEAFFPIGYGDYQNGGGQGGAWKTAGLTGVMAATLQLPDGARVTKFRAYYYTNSTHILDIELDYQMMMGGGYGILATISTSTVMTGLLSSETTAISSPVINNVDNGYLIWVYPRSTWDGWNLRVKGVSVWYTLAEAP